MFLPVFPGVIYSRILKSNLLRTSREVILTFSSMIAFFTKSNLSKLIKSFRVLRNELGFFKLIIWFYGYSFLVQILRSLGP